MPKDQLYKPTSDRSIIDRPICSEYWSTRTMTIIAGTSVIVIILVINTILKEITVKLIKWVKFDTHSE
jgi:hypothetical protein